MADSLLIDQQPLILPVLWSLAVWNQGVATTMGRECVLIPSSAKPKEELKDEVVR